DVVQETLLTVHRIRHTYDPNRSFAAWLKTIVQRRAIDVMRNRGRTVTREVHAPLVFENYSDPADGPEDAVHQADRKDLLEAAIAALPAKQRQAVEQLALKGRSLAEAAVATGLSAGSLKVNLHRALAKLHGRIGAAVKPASANSKALIGQTRACASGCV